MYLEKESKATYGRGYVYNIQYHIVWCTKYRKAVLAGGVEALLKKEVLDVANGMEFQIIAMECMPDHIHLLLSCSPQHFIPTLIKIMKGNAARHIFMQFPELKKQLWGGNLWNPSYFVATVSENTRSQIEEYIASQKTK